MADKDLLDKAVALFRRQNERGAFPGGQMVVRAEGEEVLNVSLGVARGFRSGEGERVSVTKDTPFQVMSAAKAVVAFAVAVLEDRGLLDVESPVSRYIPEFGREGKEDITVLDVLTHRSGILVPQLWDNHEIWPDWNRVQETIWNTQPLFRRGVLAYHPWEYGWILGEVVHRVAGQALDQFISDIFPPHFSALRFRLDPAETNSAARCYWLGKPKYKLGGRDVATPFEVVNNADTTLTSLVPGASMPTTASALALFYEMILAGGVTADGTRLIQSETLDRYLKPQVKGIDRTLRVRIVLGRGFQIGTLIPHLYGWWDSRSCVGHGGGFCVSAFGERRTGAAICILTNGNRGFMDFFLRFAPLNSLIRKSFRRKG